MVENKYALLDADFLSKLYITQNKKGECAIDYVLKFPGFQFLCHEQTKIEIYRHNGPVKEWLSEKIEEKVIVLYSDEQLMRVDGYYIFDAIYDDKFGLVKDGYLKLKDDKNIIK